MTTRVSSASGLSSSSTAIPSQVRQPQVDERDVRLQAADLVERVAGELDPGDELEPRGGADRAGHALVVQRVVVRHEQPRALAHSGHRASAVSTARRKTGTSIGLVT